MKCRHAKRLIYDFIDGLIGEEDRVVLEQHLGECSACEEMAAGLSKSLDLLHGIESVEPDENFTWKVRLRIARERHTAPDVATTERTWSRSWNRKFALSALSTMVVVVGAGYFALNATFFPAGDNLFPARAVSLGAESEGVVATPQIGPRQATRSVNLPPTGGRAELVSEGSPSVGAGPVPAGPLEDDAAEYSFPESLTFGQRLMPSEVRARLLQQRVNTLTRQLRECRAGRNAEEP